MHPDQEDTDSGLPKPVPTEKDNFLPMLVGLANENPEIQIGITLQMKGFLISGSLIPGDEYYAKFAKAYADGLASFGADSGSLQSIQDNLSKLGDPYREQRENPSFPKKETTYIHLNNCTFNSATNLGSFKTLWRGRISEVDGFFLGTLAAS